MNVSNPRSQPSFPVLVLPPRSPALEEIARAVLAGAAEMSNTSPPPILVAGPDENLVALGAAPLVFLGWRADRAESRRDADRAFAAIARLGSKGRYVARFEASVHGGASAHPGDTPGGGASPFGPVEPFSILATSGGEVADPHEIARARRWGAEMYSQWRSTQEQGQRAHPNPDDPPTPRAITWCGALE